MKRQDDLPIEPLSEAAFARVEAAVFAELDSSLAHPRAHLDAPVRAGAARERSRSRGFTLAWAFAVALPLGAALALAVRASLDTTPKRPSTTGLASARIVANEASTDTTLFDVSIHLERGASLVAVRDGASGSLVVLERGVARFAVPPRPERPFAVQAGDTTVEVVGTRFEVARSDAAVRVRTMEGVVRVISAGQRVLLRAGATWNSADAAGLTAPPLALDVADASRPTVPVPMDDRPAASPPAVAQTPARSGTAVARNPSSADARARFESASRLEVRDPEAALRIYASLVAHGGRWGETALYAQARLAFELNRRAEAAGLLERYLREHSQGANAEDVRALLDKLGSSSPRARE